MKPFIYTCINKSFSKSYGITFPGRRFSVVVFYSRVVFTIYSLVYRVLRSKLKSLLMYSRVI